LDSGTGEGDSMIITTATIKGGAGKSTTAAALAQLAALHGRRVLCIDLDMQGNLTTFLKGFTSEGNSYALLTGARAAAECVQDTPQGVSLIPANSDLALLKTERGSAGRLAKAIKPLSGKYDFIIIDTPPAIGEAVLNALQASDFYIIPTEANASGAQGMTQLAEVAARISAINRKLKPLGVVVTRYSGRSKVKQYIRGEIEKMATGCGLPYLGEVRQGVAIEEAQTMQENLFSYAPKSNPAQDYKTIFERAGIL